MKNVPHALETLGQLSDAADCVGARIRADLTTSDSKRSFVEKAVAAADHALARVGSVMSRLSLDGPKSQVVKSIVALRPLAKDLIAITQAAGIGPEINTFSLDVTHPVPPAQAMWEATLKSYEGDNCRQERVPPGEPGDCVVAGIHFSTLDPPLRRGPRLRDRARRRGLSPVDPHQQRLHAGEEPRR